MTPPAWPWAQRRAPHREVRLLVTDGQGDYPWVSQSSTGEVWYHHAGGRCCALRETPYDLVPLVTAQLELEL